MDNTIFPQSSLSIFNIDFLELLLSISCNKDEQLFINGILDIRGHFRNRDLNQFKTRSANFLEKNKNKQKLIDEIIIERVSKLIMPKGDYTKIAANLLFTELCEAIKTEKTDSKRFEHLMHEYISRSNVPMSYKEKDELISMAINYILSEKKTIPNTPWKVKTMEDFSEGIFNDDCLECNTLEDFLNLGNRYWLRVKLPFTASKFNAILNEKYKDLINRLHDKTYKNESTNYIATFYNDTENREIFEIGFYVLFMSFYNKTIDILDNNTYYKELTKFSERLKAKDKPYPVIKEQKKLELPETKEAPYDEASFDFHCSDCNTLEDLLKLSDLYTKTYGSKIDNVEFTKKINQKYSERIHRIHLDSKFNVESKAQVAQYFLSTDNRDAFEIGFYTLYFFDSQGLTFEIIKSYGKELKNFHERVNKPVIKEEKKEIALTEFDSYFSECETRKSMFNRICDIRNLRCYDNFFMNQKNVDLFNAYIDKQYYKMITMLINRVPNMPEIVFEYEKHLSKTIDRDTFEICFYNVVKTDNNYFLTQFNEQYNNELNKFGARCDNERKIKKEKSNATLLEKLTENSKPFVPKNGDIESGKIAFKQIKQEPLQLQKLSSLFIGVDYTIDVSILLGVFCGEAPKTNKARYGLTLLTKDGNIFISHKTKKDQQDEYTALIKHWSQYKKEHENDK